jgi:hypothetical protein
MKLRLVLPAALLAAVALAGAERGVRWIVARYVLPTHGAAWIWAPGVTVWHGPLAFFAVKDFGLDFTPREARLMVLADEEYILYLNGTQVGSGRYRAGERLDVYDVRRLLEPGENRLVVELRSSRGVGGFLATLEASAPGEHLRVVSDRGWKILRRHHSGILGAHFGVETDPRARRWAWPPTGRWGVPAPGRRLPLASQVVLPGPPVSAARVEEGFRGSQRLAAAPEDSVQVARPRRGHGPRVTFDWGEEVAGYLSIRFRGKEPRVGLVYAARERPDPYRHRPSVYVIGMEGRRSWQDSVPRRFRYVTLLGADRAVDAEVYLVDPLRAEPLFSTTEPVAGVFGIAPPAGLGAPVEDEIWRQLQGLPRRAAGKVR